LLLNNLSRKTILVFHNLIKPLKGFVPAGEEMKTAREFPVNPEHRAPGG